MVDQRVKICGYGACRACNGEGKTLIMIAVRNDLSTANEAERIYTECPHCQGTGLELYVPVAGGN